MSEEEGVFKCIPTWNTQKMWSLIMYVYIVSHCDVLDVLTHLESKWIAYCQTLFDGIHYLNLNYKHIFDIFLNRSFVDYCKKAMILTINFIYSR